MDGREFSRGLAGAAELADDGAVELHLVDLARELGAGGRRAVLPRVRDVEILLARILRTRSARHAHRPRVADIGVIGLPVQIVVEHLDARVAAVAHVDVALEVGGDRVRCVELQIGAAQLADGLHEAAVLVVLDHARIEVAVGHEDVALLIEGDVGLAAEAILLVAPVGAALARHVAETGHRIFTPANGHQHLALGAELDQHVGALVHRPDVVLGVDAHGMRKGKAVVAAANLADEHAERAVFEQPRLVGAVIDEDVALRVGGNAHVLAGVNPRRVLEEVRDRFVRNRRDVGGGGPGLGRDCAAAQDHGG